MTRRTAFNGSASGRRRERLKLAAIARGVEATQEVISSEKLHRPTPSRAVLTLSRKVDRVEKAVEPIANEVITQLVKSLELHEAIRGQMDKQNQRVWHRVKNPLGQQVNARQKVRGKSIPLI